VVAVAVAVVAVVVVVVAAAVVAAVVVVAAAAVRGTQVGDEAEGALSSPEPDGVTAAPADDYLVIGSNSNSATASPTEPQSHSVADDSFVGSGGGVGAGRTESYRLATAGGSGEWTMLQSTLEEHAGAGAASTASVAEQPLAVSPLDAHVADSEAHVADSEAHVADLEAHSAEAGSSGKLEKPKQHSASEAATPRAKKKGCCNIL
jgi:hypothetical protein